LHRRSGNLKLVNSQHSTGRTSETDIVIHTFWTYGLPLSGWFFFGMIELGDQDSGIILKVSIWDSAIFQLDIINYKINQLGASQRYEPSFRPWRFDNSFNACLIRKGYSIAIQLMSQY
jgi:hypothetical protein